MTYLQYIQQRMDEIENEVGLVRQAFDKIEQSELDLGSSKAAPTKPAPPKHSIDKIKAHIRSIVPSITFVEVPDACILLDVDIAFEWRDNLFGVGRTSLKVGEYLKNTYLTEIRAEVLEELLRDHIEYAERQKTDQ